ncbi:MAG: GGDEF domain-containing protein [Burkholderiaceae bacterium]|nr:MAG: GGDEF domain-containing protein [Burkholderiaceae bacterium]
MQTPLEHIADMTGLRDRDVMDVTLVTVLMDMLRPRSVAIYKVLGEPAKQHWITRALRKVGDVTAHSDALWGDTDRLPRYEDHPMRAEALEGQSVMRGTVNDHCLTVFPIVTDRGPIGGAEVETGAPLDLHNERLISGILRIYRNFMGLMDYSERDTLTGLLNRKSFDETFLKATRSTAVEPGDLDRRETAGHPRYWIGVIDIDHFKQVNDRFGHLIGDEVLLLVARILRSSFRFGDMMYRFGGEEFVVLLRCPSEGEASDVYERFRANLQSYGFPQVGTVTASLGFTEIRSNDTPQSAFERADKAVYYAKQHGRNQIISFHDLVRRGILEEVINVNDDAELF